MQSPVSMQVDAQRRDACGPSPLRRISITPETTSCAGAVTPAGALTGQTSTHFPQRVHASMISWTRPCNASSKKLPMGIRPVVDRLKDIVRRSCASATGRAEDVGATLVVALLPASGASGAQTGRPQGSPLQRAMLEDAEATGWP